jgi:hypothetical protein
MEETVMSTTVAPEKILKELAELWVDSGKQGQAEGGAGVLRACSMTLLVLAESGEDTQDLGETIAALMPEHPARTILVRLSGAGDRSLAERVYSQCWIRAAAADLLRAGGDHGFGRGAGRSAIGGLAAHSGGPPSDCLVPRNALARDARISRDRAHGAEGGVR